MAQERGIGGKKLYVYKLCPCDILQTCAKWSGLVTSNCKQSCCCTWALTPVYLLIGARLWQAIEQKEQDLLHAL